MAKTVDETNFNGFEFSKAKNESINKNKSLEVNNSGNISIVNQTNKVFYKDEDENETIFENEGEKLNGMTFGPKYVLILNDLSLDNPSCAILSIWNFEKDEKLEQKKICPGKEYIWKSPLNKTYRIKVIEIAPGYSFGSTWAEIIIYS